MEQTNTNTTDDRPRVNVLDKGYVILDDHMGNDLAVVNAARVSYAKRHTEIDPAKDPKFINYLVKHRHTSPFEHTALKFEIKAPLFVRSQWHRHRTWAYNEVSGRYVDLTHAEYYIPDQWRVKAETNKQGSRLPEADEEYLLGDIQRWNKDNSKEVENILYYSKDLYEFLVAREVAPEMARMVLPQNMYTTFYGTVNLSNFMKFLSLRDADDAQWEIRQYAKALRELAGPLFPYSLAAWDEYGRL